MAIGRTPLFRVESVVFLSGQIELPVIYRFIDQLGLTTLSEAVFGIDRPDQRSKVSGKCGFKA
jgi:hypothetical protein